jgi:hypothetical protein
MVTSTADARRGSYSDATPCKCKCPDCGKFHWVDRSTFAGFGYDCYCMPCVDWSHVAFMKKNAKRFGMTCVKGCRCGFGK